MGRVALDSSVIIAFFVANDAHHDKAVSALRELDSDAVLIPAVTYAEVMVGAVRSGSAARRRFERFFDEMGPIEPVTSEIALRAARLRAEHGSLRLPDALVIATGHELGAERILTTDASWRAISKRVVVLR